MTDHQAAAVVRMIDRNQNNGKKPKGRLFPCTLRLPRDVDAAIDRLALENDVRRSKVINALLRKALDMPEIRITDPLRLDKSILKDQ